MTLRTVLQEITFEGLIACFYERVPADVCGGIVSCTSATPPIVAELSFEGLILEETKKCPDGALIEVRCVLIAVSNCHI